MNTGFVQLGKYPVFSWICLTVSLWWIFSKAQAETSSPDASKPNIVFILADDLGWTDAGSFGSDFIETPNIDRLRRQGMLFTDAYATAPVCTPSRAALLTGRYQARFGMTDVAGKKQQDYMTPVVEPLKHLNLPSSELTLAKVLKSAGYATGCIGKWHVGDQNKPGYTQKDAGFDFVVKDPNNAANKGQMIYPGDPKCVQHFTDDAIGFIEKNKDTPFFLYLAHLAPHTPAEAPDDLIEKYKAKRRPGLKHSNVMYAAMMEYFDRGIGQLLEKIDELGLADRTLVVFTSDNGGRNSNYDYEIFTNNDPLRWGKHTLAEGGIRVPLILRWPGVIPADSTCSVPVINLDYLPTFAELAGVPAENLKAPDGVSLVPLFSEKGKLSDREFYFYYPHYVFGSDFGKSTLRSNRPATSVRSGDYKFIDYFEDPHMVELYHLGNDISEKTNLARVMPEKVEELRAKIRQWHSEVDAELPVERKDYDKRLFGNPLKTSRDVGENE